MYDNNIYPVKFRDLINEFANLCEMNSKSDIIGFYVTTSVCYYGRYSLEKLIELTNNKDFNFRYGNDYLHLILYGKKNNKYIFFYNIKFKLNFNEKEVDGKKLLDYSKVVKGNSNLKRLNYSRIDIDNNVDNLILYFDEDIINKEESRDFYPTSLLKDIVHNCYNKSRKNKKR